MLRVKCGYRRGRRVRLDRDRRGTERAGRGGLRSVGRAERAGTGEHRTRRPSRVEFPHRELSRFPHGNFRAGACRTRLRASGEVRGAYRDRAFRPRTPVRPLAVHRRRRRWRVRTVSQHHRRRGRAISQAAAAQPGSVRRQRRILRRNPHGGSTVCESGSGHRRRRKLGRPGRYISGRACQTRPPAGPRSGARRYHVPLSDLAD